MVGLVLSNVIYPLGAVALAVVVGVVLALRHRKPKSVEANISSFNRGLRALAPDTEPMAHRRGMASQPDRRTSPVPPTVESTNRPPVRPRRRRTEAETG
jgi:hypothetical protein